MECERRRSNVLIISLTGISMQCHHFTWYAMIRRKCVLRDTGYFNVFFVLHFFFLQFSTISPTRDCRRETIRYK